MSRDLGNMAAFLTFVLLILFTFVLPWRAMIVLDPGVTIGYVFGFVLFSTWLVSVFFNGFRNLHIFHIFLGIFVLLHTLSIIWGGEVTSAITYISILLLSLVLWDVCISKQRLLYVLQSFVVGASIVFASVFYNYLNGNYFRDSARIAASGYWPNTTSIILVTSLFISAYIIMNVSELDGGLRRISITFNILYIPLPFIGVFLTASRQGMVFLILGVIILALVSGLNYGVVQSFRDLTNILRTLLLIFISLSGLLITLFVGGFRTDRYISLDDGGLRTLNDRIYLWDASLQAFQQRPVFGFGTGTASETIPPFGPSTLDLDRTYDPHSNILTTIVEVGFLGGLIYTAIILLIIYMLYSNLRDVSRLFWCGFIASLLMVSMIETLVDDLLFWFLLSIIPIVSFPPRVSYRGWTFPDKLPW